MAVAMEDWSRPAYEPGGGDATLFYLAFGALGPVRLPPTPAGLWLTVHPQGETVWVEPLVAASADAIDDQPQLAALVRGAPDFAVLRGRRTDPPDLAHLRDAEGCRWSRPAEKSGPGRAPRASRSTRLQQRRRASDSSAGGTRWKRRSGRPNFRSPRVSTSPCRARTET